MIINLEVTLPLQSCLLESPPLQSCSSVALSKTWLPDEPECFHSSVTVTHSLHTAFNRMLISVPQAFQDKTGVGPAPPKEFKMNARVWNTWRVPRQADWDITQTQSWIMSFSKEFQHNSWRSMGNQYPKGFEGRELSHILPPGFIETGSQHSSITRVPSPNRLQGQKVNRNP